MLTTSQGKGEEECPGKEKGRGCWGRVGRWVKRVVFGRRGTWGVLVVLEDGRTTVWEKVDDKGRRTKLVRVVEVSRLGEGEAQGLYPLSSYHRRV